MFTTGKAMIARRRRIIAEGDDGEYDVAEG
jgi:hypothetical protein